MAEAPENNPPKKPMDLPGPSGSSGSKKKGKAAKRRAAKAAAKSELPCKFRHVACKCGAQLEENHHEPVLGAEEDPTANQTADEILADIHNTINETAETVDRLIDVLQDIHFPDMPNPADGDELPETLIQAMLARFMEISENPEEQEFLENILSYNPPNQGLGKKK